MSILQLIFYCFAALTIMSALVILFSNNVLHAVLSLLGVFLGVSAMYVFAGAEFLAVAQLVVYVGGVLVLLLFGVMFTNREIGVDFPVSTHRYLPIGLLAGLAIALGLSYLLLSNATLLHAYETVLNSKPNSSTKIIGINLMSSYLLIFELLGILLLVALIGASFVAGRKEITK